MQHQEVVKEGTTTGRPVPSGRNRGLPGVYAAAAGQPDLKLVMLKELSAGALQTDRKGELHTHPHTHINSPQETAASDTTAVLLVCTAHHEALAVEPAEVLGPALHCMVDLLQQWTVVIVDRVHLAQHHMILSQQHMKDVQGDHRQLIPGTCDNHSSTAIIKGASRAHSQPANLRQIHQQKH
jgi:hypothetical protein